MFHSNTEKLKKLFHISLDLYLGYSIIIMLLDSNIKLLASSTTFIPRPLVFRPSWNRAPPRGKKARKKIGEQSEPSEGLGRGKSCAFPTFSTKERSLVPSYSHFKIQRESKGTRDSNLRVRDVGSAMCSYLLWIVWISDFHGPSVLSPSCRGVPVSKDKKHFARWLFVNTIRDFSGLKNVFLD